MIIIERLNRWQVSCFWWRNSDVKHNSCSQRCVTGVLSFHWGSQLRVVFVVVGGELDCVIVNATTCL